jgi:hypothetical protein
MQGRWDYPTLVRWRDQLRTELGRGAARVDIRVDWNRIEIGVVGGAAAQRARQTVARSGIPAAAAMVVSAQ